MPPLCEAQQCTKVIPDAATTSMPPISRSIARLHSYTSLAAAERMVASVLSGLPAWHFPARSPLVVAHDTDFVVVAAPVSELLAVTTALEASPYIRDVHVDRVVHRQLSSVSDTDSEASGAFRASQTASSDVRTPQGVMVAPTRHGLVAGLGNNSSEAVTKQPGRLRTAWSIDPEKDEDADADEAGALNAQAAILQSRFRAHGRSQAYSASESDGREVHGSLGKGHDKGKFPAGHVAEWGPLLHGPEDVAVEGDAAARGRRLQGQGGATQVTSALSAPAVWNKGFSGRGIRVGAVHCWLAFFPIAS